MFKTLEELLNYNIKILTKIRLQNIQKLAMPIPILSNEVM